MKEFHVYNNIGKAKYVVNHHDGEKKHNDGSDFYDMTIFSNKKKLSSFVDGLRAKGYSCKNEKPSHNYDLAGGR